MQNRAARVKLESTWNESRDEFAMSSEPALREKGSEVYPIVMVPEESYKT